MSVPGGAPRALVADDDPSVRKLVQAVLEGEAFRVRPCADGSAALRLALAARFDLLVLDVSMPRATGIEVLQALRCRGLHPPVVLMSSDAPEGIRALCLRVEKAIFLAKPFRISELRSAVASAAAATR
jgi:two-component system OmpR family response regulator